MTRRSVLRMTTAVAGLALAPTRAVADGPSPAMAALSAYMSEAGARALPADVAEQAKHHLIDTLAAMVSGSQLPPGQAAVRHVTAHAGTGGATVAGTALTAAPLDAALANGVMAHADETDDSHGPSR